MNPKPNPDYSAACIKRIKAIARKQYSGVKEVLHIKPRAYCVAKPAELCAVFVTPRCDAAEHLRVFDSSTATDCNDYAHEGNLLAKVNAGDWCSLAYIARDGKYGQTYVIEILS